MKMEDLEQILPDRVGSLSGKRLILILGLLVGVLFVVCLTLGAVAGVALKNPPAPSISIPSGTWNEKMTAELKDAGVCMTPECMRSAAWLVSNLDQTVDPCEDFYKFACGGWQKKARLSPEISEVDVERQVEKDNELRVRELLDSPIKRNTERSSERKMKQFFQMCIHEYGRIKNGGQELLSLINDRVGGWSALDPNNWQGANWDMERALKAANTELRADALFSVTIEHYFSDDGNVPQVRYDGLTMFYRDYHDDDKSGMQDAYKDYMRRVGDLLLRDANLTLDASEHAHRIEQFVEDAYFMESNISRNIVKSYFASGAINSDSTVLLRNPTYFRLLDGLLRNESQSHVMKRVLNNYIVWRVLVEYIPHLSWEYRAASYRYRDARYGTSEYPATWDTCVYTLKKTMAPALAAEFLNVHVGKRKKNEVSDMMKTIMQSVNATIDGATWMDRPTKERAKLKMKAVTMTIGFPESYFEPRHLDSIHLALKVDISDGYIKNLYHLNSFRRELFTLELQSDDDYYTWQYILGVGGFGVIPWMFWTSNHMMVPAGALQAPLYVPDRPHALNYGSLGVTLSAEALVAISEMGRYVWTNGSFYDWWSDDSDEEYSTRRSCFLDYFDGAQLGPFLINGRNETVEITGGYTEAWRVIEYLAGLRNTYKAYKGHVMKSGEDEMPLGINLNADQAFFASAAQAKCYIRTDEAAYQQAVRGIPSYDTILNGALRHMKEFTNAFSCKKTSRLHALSNSTCEIY
ncbi:hypothetical protein CAPTEDRAFT_223071 [Capitella teleta]|uniref:Peptidase M13 N-terminal domain-containing protein n=1 Tax=Capitella teleta TaxID=283909 RepID=R7U6Z5_CAPTE|nr:hypothetical protein CAPTEDRAFT_223071 [Capitella teleta]|eukprot:ELT98895.1 hypothetical protein CAPTEDRAFT_223071 [Capitella teleta]